MDIQILLPILAGGFRSISGWLSNALSDGKIDAFEWGKLFSTIVEISVIAISAMYGLGLSVEQASGVGILASFALSSVKKAGTKK